MTNNKYSEYHLLIPERLGVLEEINTILKNKATIHYSHKFAQRKLSLISYIVNPKEKETIMITAGCHGNEPTPVYALLNFLKKQSSIKNKRIIIIPCIVPFGFVTHTDRNKYGVDINRDFFTTNPQKETKVLKNLVKKFKPSFVINMHEDPDEKMFFIYSEGKEAKPIAQKILKEISKDMNYYKKKKVHNDIVINGIIESSNPGTSFEDYLTTMNIPNLCIETPGLYSLKTRIKVYDKIINLITSKSFQKI